MKVHVLFGEAHLEVNVQRERQGLRVELDGRAFGVDVGVLREGAAYSLLIDGRSIDVAVEERGDVLDLIIAGRRYSTEVLGEREWLARSIQGPVDEGERVVRASMTGIIRDVLVAPGDSVARGQTVFILEAMKMENEVKAQVDGVVRRVAAAAGSTVSLGDAVVEID